jgi:hypothetical protein
MAESRLRIMPIPYLKKELSVWPRARVKPYLILEVRLGAKPKPNVRQVSAQT